MLKYTFRVYVKGIVQGVGFRPFIYKLASLYKFKGYVNNTKKGVEILISESTPEEIEKFCADIHELSPAGSLIQSIYSVQEHYQYYSDFNIIKSDYTEGITAIPPDLSVCDDCLGEINDKNNRRYMYPFTNCTNCGPRYSIITNIPYDRENTTMSEFIMCEKCLQEFKNVFDRRYHAQPTCCPDCGPVVFSDYDKNLDAIKKTAAIVNHGGLVALKGLGGYHLICDATNDSAVQKLRALKKRAYKPVAVMVLSATKLRKYLKKHNNEALNIMDSPIAPIVINDWGLLPISGYINPTGSKIGIMKAYTPLHYILFKFLKTDFLVATSGNKREEPICINETEALTNLSEFTENFLHHNRKIHTRVDDSVVTLIDNKIYTLRRARGLAPKPVILPKPANLQIAGMGAHLKSTITFAAEKYAFVSQHIGDLDNSKSSDFYCEVYEKMKKLFHLDPQILITDYHPDYFSSKFAINEKKSIYPVQHHMAHMYSCMAENGLTDNVIGVIMDGTGLGEDNNIWGGEFFLLQEKITREYHFKNYIQPGMDSAAKHPSRMLAGYFYQMGILESHQELLHTVISKKDTDMIKQIIDKGINCIHTSSAGRFFEAVGSLLTGHSTNEYEGFTAILSENLIKDSDGKNVFYQYNIADKEIDFSNILIGICDDIYLGIDKSIISKKFHDSIAKMICDTCRLISQASECKRVILSGGVFQNMYLLEKTKNMLNSMNFEVFTHKEVPANDGGISLGQVYKYILNHC